MERLSLLWFWIYKYHIYPKYLDTLTLRSLLLHKNWKHLLHFALFLALFCFAFSPMSPESFCATKQYTVMPAEFHPQQTLWSKVGSAYHWGLQMLLEVSYMEHLSCLYCVLNEKGSSPHSSNSHVNQSAVFLRGHNSCRNTWINDIFKAKQCLDLLCYHMNFLWIRWKKVTNYSIENQCLLINKGSLKSKFISTISTLNIWTP